MNWRLGANLFLQRLGGAQVSHRLREFESAALLSRREYNDLCEGRLRRVLDAARRSVPFYRERIAVERPILSDFPIVLRSDVQGSFEDFKTTDPVKSHWGGYGAIAVQSGGTTGSPITVVHDAAFRDAGRASRLFSQALCGFPFGTPYVQVWGSMRDINQARDSLAKRTIAWLSGHRVLNAFRTDPELLDRYLAVLSRSGVKHIMAFADVAEVLADHAIAKQTSNVEIETLMACAGTVSPRMREVVQRAFGARVHNKYGSRECTDMACECGAGGIHVYAHHTYLEVVDEAGRPSNPGEPGRILVTLVGNSAFPLIRYEIGDMGTLRDGECECGITWPLLGSIEGRTTDRICSVRGGYVSPAYIRHLVGVVHNPEGIWNRFQFSQLAANCYDLALQPRSTPSPERLRQIETDLRSVLGDSAQIIVRTVDHIPNSKSGKFSYVQNLTPK